MYQSFVFDHGNRRWVPDQYFSYPRIGSFEVFVKKGRQRIEARAGGRSGLWTAVSTLLQPCKQ